MNFSYLKNLSQTNLDFMVRMRWTHDLQWWAPLKRVEIKNEILILYRQKSQFRFFILKGGMGGEGSGGL